MQEAPLPLSQRPSRSHPEAPQPPGAQDLGMTARRAKRQRAWSALTAPWARGSVKSFWRFPGLRGGGNLIMSTGDNEERVIFGVLAAHADSFGLRGSLLSPRAVSLSAKRKRSWGP
jgi:hypothetical protein